MKTKKNVMINSLAALTLLAITVASAGSVLAFGGHMMGQGEDHEAMIETLENQDYATWQELMSQNPRGEMLLEFIDEDEFASFSGKMLERHEIMQEKRAAMQEVLANRDYEGWKELVSEHPRAETNFQEVTEDNFDKFAEAMELAQAGDFEAAKEIRDELGLKAMGRMKGGRGMNK